MAVFSWAASLQLLSILVQKVFPPNAQVTWKVTIQAISDEWWQTLQAKPWLASAASWINQHNQQPPAPSLKTKWGKYFIVCSECTFLALMLPMSLKYIQVYDGSHVSLACFLRAQNHLSWRNWTQQSSCLLTWFTHWSCTKRRRGYVSRWLLRIKQLPGRPALWSSHSVPQRTGWSGITDRTRVLVKTKARPSRGTQQPKREVHRFLRQGASPDSSAHNFHRPSEHLEIRMHPANRTEPGLCHRERVGQGGYWSTVYGKENYKQSWCPNIGNWLNKLRHNHEAI